MTVAFDRPVSGMIVTIFIVIVINNHYDFTSDTGSEAVERSDIEADFATGVGLETLSHNHNDGDDDDDDGDDGDGDVQWARHLVAQSQ